MIRAITISIVLAILLMCVQLPGNTQTADPQPALLYSPFLNAFTIAERTGEISLDSFWGINFPDSDPEKYYQYSRDDDAKSLYAEISSYETEEIIARLDFYARWTDTNYHLISHFSGTDYRTGNDQAVGFILDEGDYAIDFYIEDEPLFHFPFTVDVLPSEDGYSDEPYYFLEGGWEDWSYFIYDGADPEEPLVWKVWLRNKAGEHEYNYTVLAELKRDGYGVIATGREGESYNLRPVWIRADFDLVNPHDGSLFRAKQVLDHDGSYTMTLKLNDELYGTWEFEIEDGHFVYEDRADIEITDPVDFIAGGPDAFFYKRQ